MTGPADILRQLEQAGPTGPRIARAVRRAARSVRVRGTGPPPRAAGARRLPPRDRARRRTRRTRSRRCSWSSRRRRDGSRNPDLLGNWLLRRRGAGREQGPAIGRAPPRPGGCGVTTARPARRSPCPRDPGARTDSRRGTRGAAGVVPRRDPALRSARRVARGSGRGSWACPKGRCRAGWRTAGRSSRRGSRSAASRCRSRACWAVVGQAQAAVAVPSRTVHENLRARGGLVGRRGRARPARQAR